MKTVFALLVLVTTVSPALAADRAKCDAGLDNFQKLAKLKKTPKEVANCVSGKGGYTDAILDCMTAAKTVKEINACLPHYARKQAHFFPALRCARTQ